MSSFDILWTLLLGFHFWTEVDAGGAADINRLHNKLFQGDYNRMVRPSLDYSRPINVLTHLSVTAVQSLDIKHQVLYFRGVLHFAWTDELLSWEPREYGNISKTVMPQSMIWRPDIVITNALTDHMYLWEDGASLVALQHDGYVRWEPIINLGVSCKVDISKYPFDRNICSLIISSWMHDMNSVNLTFDEPAIILDYMISNGEFQVTSHGVDTSLYPSFNLHYIQCSFYLRLSRRPAYVTMTLLTPVSLMAVLGGVSFLMPPGEPERLTMSITVVLSFTVFLGIIDGGLPGTSENISLLVVYVVVLLLLAFLVVVCNSVVYLVHRHETRRAQELRLLPSNRDVLDLNENKDPTLKDHDLSETGSANELSRKPQNGVTFGDLPKTIKNESQRELSYTEPTGTIAGSFTNVKSVADQLNRYFIVLVLVSFFLIIAVMFPLMLS